MIEIIIFRCELYQMRLYSCRSTWARRRIWMGFTTFDFEADRDSEVRSSLVKHASALIVKFSSDKSQPYTFTGYTHKLYIRKRDSLRFWKRFIQLVLLHHIPNHVQHFTTSTNNYSYFPLVDHGLLKNVETSSCEHLLPRTHSISCRILPGENGKFVRPICRAFTPN